MTVASMLVVSAKIHHFRSFSPGGGVAGEHIVFLASQIRLFLCLFCKPKSSACSGILLTFSVDSWARRSADTLE